MQDGILTAIDSRGGDAAESWLQYASGCMHGSIGSAGLANQTTGSIMAVPRVPGAFHPEAVEQVQVSADPLVSFSVGWRGWDGSAGDICAVGVVGSGCFGVWDGGGGGWRHPLLISRSNPFHLYDLHVFTWSHPCL